MKQIGLLILAILFSLTPIQSQTNKAKPEMAFDKTTDGITFHDFGSIIYGANGKVDFTYTNQGTIPLIIADVKSSCGCTVPSWTKEPVAPGQKGTIKIEYNTKLPGPFNKTVVVYSNANNSPVRLEIRGKVNSQPGDIKQGDPALQKHDALAIEPAESSAVKQAVETDANAVSTDAAELKKAKQKAAYQERIKKEQSNETSSAKTGTEAKQTGKTTTKQAAVATPVKK